MADTENEKYQRGLSNFANAAEAAANGRRQKQLEIIRKYNMQFGMVDTSPEQLSDEMVQILAGFIIKENRNL